MRSTDYLSNEKRARPSRTHSTEGPLRTRLECIPKDAPRMDASFACSSPMQNISGISVEPLLRTNAKSQAVTGEPGRAGSSPIAPAATTPQPAGRSIAKYAHPWRAYFGGVEKRWRLRAARSERERQKLVPCRPKELFPVHRVHRHAPLLARDLNVGHVF